MAFRPLITVVLLAQAFAAQAAEPASPNHDDPLARLVDIAFHIGFGGPLGGKVCTALGITKDNQSFPVEQVSVGTSANGRSLSVSKHRGRLDIILSHKTKDDAMVFLSSEKGSLDKAIQEKGGKSITEIPIAEADAAFQTEKAWWLTAWLPAYESGQMRRK